MIKFELKCPIEDTDTTENTDYQYTEDEFWLLLKNESIQMVATLIRSRSIRHFEHEIRQIGTQKMSKVPIFEVPNSINGAQVVFPEEDFSIIY